MTTLSPQTFVILAAILFAIGAVGVLLRRNVLIVLMGIELMLNAGNLVFAAYARTFGDASGHVAILIIMAVAAAEAALGLAIVLGAFGSEETTDVRAFTRLRELR